jgi:putative MFS transporter
MPGSLASERAALLLARIEHLPVTSWHVKARLVMGVATFFDAFDVLTIAYVLPVLAGVWRLKPQEIGFLISASFVGQIFGALFFGWLAERIGRVPSATYTIALYSVTGIGCALSWNFASLFLFRIIQGIGLGGEVPIAAAYINEIFRARGRGRFFLLYELIFPAGLVGAGLLGFWLVPRLGWQSMFVIGAFPAVLALLLRRILPESPRWLISKGFLDKAERVVADAERSAIREGKQTILPLPSGQSSVQPELASSWLELFRGRYRRRTFIVWGLWTFTYFITYGINTWLPTIYRSFYRMSISDALRNGLVTNLAGLAGAFFCALAVDRLGRRPWFVAAFLIGSAPLLGLWWLGAKTPVQVLVLASVSFMFITSNAMLVYLYTPEIYPTRLRALGTGTASAWLRVASAVGPAAVGFTLSDYGIRGVFLLFGVLGIAGGVLALGATETRERPLEEISP